MILQMDIGDILGLLLLLLLCVPVSLSIIDWVSWKIRCRKGFSWDKLCILLKPALMAMWQIEVLNMPETIHSMGDTTFDEWFEKEIKEKPYKPEIYNNGYNFKARNEVLLYVAAKLRKDNGIEDKK